jgi:hypothetical protein
MTVLRDMDCDAVARDLAEELELPLLPPLMRMNKGVVLAQANAALANPLTPLQRMGVFAAVAGAMTSLSDGDSEGGGGDDRPDWVPADAVIHVDLVGGSPQGRAWTLADGEVAVDTLLGVDVNTTTSWFASGYDSEDYVVDGYCYSDLLPAFIGTLRSTVLDSCTITLRAKQLVEVTGDNPELVLADATGNNVIEFVTYGFDLTANAYSWNGSLSSTIPAIMNTGMGAINMFAATITATRFDIAVNGSTAVAGVTDATDRPPGAPMVSAFFDAGSGDWAIQSITLYDALPSTAGLSALSETA